MGAPCKEEPVDWSNGVSRWMKCLAASFGAPVQCFTLLSPLAADRNRNEFEDEYTKRKGGKAGGAPDRKGMDRKRPAPDSRSSGKKKSSTPSPQKNGSAKRRRDSDSKGSEHRKKHKK